MEIKAKAKFIRMSPKKVRLVVNLIKGLDVEEALEQLKVVKKDAALPVSKLIKSMIANAQENHELKKDNLMISEARVDEGPTLKRFRPRAMGRATPIRKRSSHIAITLAEKVPTKAKVDNKKKEKNQDDIIKVADLDELKALEKEDKHDDKNGEGKGQDKTSHGAGKKGFAKRIFNRKSG